MMGARPQAVGYGLTDSPAGLAGWMLVHSGFAKWSYGKDPKQSPTRDDVLDNFSLYWLTNTAASSARIYWENRGGSLISAGDQKTAEITVPVAITVFPDEVLRAQEAWARRAFPKLTTSTRSIAAATSPCGNTRSCSRRSCARRSDRCASESVGADDAPKVRVVCCPSSQWDSHGGGSHARALHLARRSNRNQKHLRRTT